MNDLTKVMKIDTYTILFHNFNESKVAVNNAILNYILCLGKYCIWLLRNQAKFEHEKVTVTRIITVFLAHLRTRIHADFLRYEKTQFVKVWCKNTVFAKIENCEMFHVVLKPP